MAEKKSEDDIKALVSHEISSARLYDQEDLSDNRAKAIASFLGDLEDDVPSPPNRSKVTDKSVSSVLGWMLPGIIRCFTASGVMTEYQPTSEEDEESAKQASEYMHYCFWVKNEGYKILYEGTHDSLLLKNGIIKTWWDDTEESAQEQFSGLDIESVTQLEQDPSVEILAATENEPMETGQVDEMGQPVFAQSYDIKIKRSKGAKGLCFDVVEPENFGINRQAKSISDARFIYQRETKTRSELIQMGFDKTKIENLPSF